MSARADLIALLELRQEMLIKTSLYELHAKYTREARELRYRICLIEAKIEAIDEIFFRMGEGR